MIMKKILLLTIFLNLYQCAAQEKEIFSKVEGSIKYRLILEKPNKFSFQNEVAAHGTVITVIETGEALKKNDTLFLLVRRTGNNLSEMKDVIGSDTLIAVRKNRNNILYYGRNTSSIRMKRKF